jgi:cell division protein FtsI/penicillin-binding protein 2
VERAAGIGLLTISLGVALIAGCTAPGPDPTPYPTPAPRADPAAAPATVTRYLSAWRAGHYRAMYRLVSAVARRHVSERRFTSLHRDFAQMLGVTAVRWTASAPLPVALPAEPLPTAPPEASNVAPAGPVPGLSVRVGLHLDTTHFGRLDLDRDLVLVANRDRWELRWSPRVIFPALGDDGRLRMARTPSPRGRILSVDGTVFARTGPDGVRVYPQEWLAGQTIGYVSRVTADDLRDLRDEGYVAGDVIGRSGLEAGAEQLLRGRPGYRLEAVRRAGKPETILNRRMIPGADLTITIRRVIQATADAAISGYGEAGTAVLDPKSGDVWALASAPPFNPNAMTLGTTLAGAPLAPPSAAQITNHAVLGAYPAGSSFKPFTLAAALKTGVASPATRMTCNGTWVYNGFTFHNYMDHSLGGLVSLPEAMAFSCNTTYMPLSILVYEKDPHALTETVAEFGFGEFTGIGYVEEESGILPDHAYYRNTPRWHGRISPYNGFDQVQLAIGQGDFLGTPLQLANAYAAFGNGGRLWVPRLVLKATLPDGTVLERNRPTVKHRIGLSRGKLAYVVESLKAVVNLPYGTAYGAFLGFGIQVAGKSGTAETGTPTPDAWFPAFAPADNPQIAAATVLVHVPLATGGSDSAPLIRQVFATYFANR